jgi:hypothetical protein
MNKKKVGQDFNHIGTKYQCAVDNGAIPRWMPYAFWAGVAGGFVVGAVVLWWVF